MDRKKKKKIKKERPESKPDSRLASVNNIHPMKRKPMMEKRQKEGKK